MIVITIRATHAEEPAIVSVDPLDVVVHIAEMIQPPLVVVQVAHRHDGATVDIAHFDVLLIVIPVLAVPIVLFVSTLTHGAVVAYEDYVSGKGPKLGQDTCYRTDVAPMSYLVNLRALLHDVAVKGVAVFPH